MGRVLLYVPYEEKEEAKVLDARYNTNLKMWECDDDKKICIERWSIRYVDIPYDKKDEYKKYGIKWDSSEKKWFTYNSNKNI